jgi:AcrR family transcriptional regulator
MNILPMTKIQNLRRTELRGTQTRQKLIEVALELFGTRGFHGTTVRNIAQAAGANVAAVGYHFGGKEGLYLAVAHYLGDTVVSVMGAMARDAAARLANAGGDNNTARLILSDFMARLVRQVIRTRRNNAVIGFVIGEQLRPTDAFPILYENGLRQLHESLAAIVAVIDDRRPDDEISIIVAMTLFGQAFSFGVGQTTLLARLDRQELSAASVDRIAAIIGETTIGSVIHLSRHALEKP